MTELILKCVKCGRYTMKNKCTKCGVEALSTKPPRFSIEDKYGKYRLQYKKEHAESQDL